MKFVVDVCVGPTVVRWLRDLGYDVLSIGEKMAGANDEEILHCAWMQGRILITDDKDFGEIVFRQRKEHSGIILLRLTDERPKNKMRVLEKILQNHSHEIAYNFIVATEQTIRVTQTRFQIH